MALVLRTFAVLPATGDWKCGDNADNTVGYKSGPTGTDPIFTQPLYPLELDLTQT